MHDGLVKRLKNEAETERYLLPHSDNGTAALLDKAADAIEALSVVVRAQKAVLDKFPRWIPVTETPPLKVGDDGYNGYLVYANGYYEVADYTTDKFDNVPYFHVNGEWETNVTHWMPLPSAPAEE